MKSLHLKFQIINIFFLLAILSASPSYAHVLQSNNDIGAVLHITPDDDPIAGAVSNFFFSFKDKNNAFILSQCVCEMKILQGEKEIYSQPLIQRYENSESDATASYTFPQKNIYTIQVSGKPIGGNAFKTFTLTYPIRVEKEASIQENAAVNATTFSQYLPLFLLLVAASIFSVIIVVRKRSRS